MAQKLLSRTWHSTGLLRSCGRPRESMGRITGIIGVDLIFRHHRHTRLSVKEVKPVPMTEINNVLQDIVSSTGELSDDYLPVRESQAECPVRSMQDSYQELVIPLEHDSTERDKYLDYLGGMRFGRILEDLDVFAWWCCHHHCQEPAKEGNEEGKLLKSRMATITAGVDRIELHADNASISPFKDMKLCGHVMWVGRSSLEVTMTVSQEQDGIMQEKMVAHYVMASRNPLTQQAAIVNPLKPDGKLEEELYELGKKNRKKRMEAASTSLLKMVPNNQECNIIHDLFIKTVDHRSGTFKVSNPPPNTVWMSNTQLKTIILCHPEKRNVYQKIFGGFLMRQAFELAWSDAALYSKCRPVIKIVDDITFRKPVEIGSMLFLSSKVVYTRGSVVQVNVHASVADPITGVRQDTSHFYFAFDTGRADLPQVMPYSYAEAMLYLDGMRHLYDS